MFQIICEYIDKEEASDHLDEGERHGLKATAFRLCVTISSHQACKTAFAPRANEALLTPSVVTWRRSLALAVLLTALGLSAFTSSSVTPETLARAIERDATIRANARKSQCSIVNFLHRNNAFFSLSHTRIMGRERRVCASYLRPSVVRACGVILSA